MRLRKEGCGTDIDGQLQREHLRQMSEMSLCPSFDPSAVEAGYIDYVECRKCKYTLLSNVLAHLPLNTHGV